MQANIRLVIDVIVYFLFPILFWDAGRGFFGDYATILFSTVPGILYTLYRFKITERFNFTGLFIIFNLCTGIMVDLLSGSALQLLWNNVFLSFFLLIIYLVSYIIKKPIHLFFTLDILVLKGHDKSLTKEILYERKPLLLLNFTTLIYCVGEFGYAVILMNWISTYGVEAFHLDIILDNIFNIIMTGITIIPLFYIDSMIDEIVPVHKKRLYKKSFRCDEILLEKSYFYFCNHH